jgi:prepilin-type N-terminal cleavage/methylation domain-containing protein
MAKNRRGFTLIELIVVVLIIGILASMGMPYYFKTVETSKATDAVAIGHLLGNANRMYLIDNPPPAPGISGQVTNGCNGVACTAASGACKLIACSYVATPRTISSSATAARGEAAAPAVRSPAPPARRPRRATTPGGGTGSRTTAPASL